MLLKRPPSHPNSPLPLHISLVARGRERTQRVTYLLAADGSGTERGVAERVVLHRWKQRTLTGYRFLGARLSPSFWWALPEALGDDVRTWSGFDATTIDEAIKIWRDVRTPTFSLPAAQAVHAVIQACGPQRLCQLVDRYAVGLPTRASGVPDLFLYALDTAARLRAVQFVEVKRPGETVSEEQRASTCVTRSPFRHQNVLGRVGAIALRSAA